MSVFQYKNADGTLLEREYPIGRAPDKVRVQDVVYHRVLSVPSVLVRPGVRFTSNVVGLNDPDAPRKDARGRAQFDGMQEVREFQAKKSGEGNGELVHTRDD
jgi:hypothetical protein